MGNSLESRSWEGWQSGASLVESSRRPAQLSTWTTDKHSQALSLPMVLRVGRSAGASLESSMEAAYMCRSATLPNCGILVSGSSTLANCGILGTSSNSLS